MLGTILDYQTQEKSHGAIVKQNIKFGASEMPQWKKTLTTKPDNLVEGRVWIPTSCPLASTPIICVHTYMLSKCSS